MAKIDIDIDLLKRLYLDHGIGIEFLARKVFYVSKDTLYDRLKQHQIQTVSHQNKIDINKLNHLYYEKLMSLQKLSNYFDCSQTKILKVMKDNNMHRRGQWDYIKIRREKNEIKQ
jgi:hypothetical protein